MAEKQPWNDDLESFAGALSSLTPQPTRLSRDRLMEDVWRSAALRSENLTTLRFWKLATGVSTLTAATLAGLLLTQSVNRTVVDPSFESPRPTESVAIRCDTEQRQGLDPKRIKDGPSSDFGLSYISERNRALAEGTENFPWPQISAPSNSIGSATIRELRESIIRSQDSGG